MSEFTAALGLVQTERLDEIVAWKNAVARDAARPGAPEPLRAARRDDLGLYKYIVFDPIERSTGQGLRRAVPPHHRHRRRPARTPTGWPRNHWCVPLYYRPRRGGDGRSGGAVRVLVTGGSGFIGSHVVDRLLDAGREPRIYDLRAVAVPRADAIETVDRRPHSIARRSRAALEGCDAIIHLAAAADVGAGREDPAGAERSTPAGR